MATRQAILSNIYLEIDDIITVMEKMILSGMTKGKEILLMGLQKNINSKMDVLERMSKFGDFNVGLSTRMTERLTRLYILASAND